MGSREDSNKITNIFQSHYYINAYNGSKCVMERWTKKRIYPMSSQSLQEAFTKSISFTDVYASTCAFFETQLRISNTTCKLYIYVDCSCINACRVVVLLQCIWERVCMFGVILARSYNILFVSHSGGSTVKMTSLMMVRDLFGMFALNSNIVRIFAICSMCCLVMESFNMLFSNIEWWPLEVFYRLFFFSYYCLFKWESDVPFHLHDYPITCKDGHEGCGSNLNTITLS